MIFILYSAQYELFMSRNLLSEEEVLIQPTSSLFDLCEDLGIPLTLFCDFLCMQWYRKHGLDRFPDAIDMQLKDAVRRGHDVQTLLHSHWLVTRKEGDSFISDHKNPCSTPEEIFAVASKHLREAKEYFTHLLKPVDSRYSCLAFRAGGYGIQPHDREILGALENEGYLIDSTLVPGWVPRNASSRIDFSSLPSTSNFWISGAKGIAAEAPWGEGLFEVPVASGKLTPWDKLLVMSEYGKLLARRTIEGKQRRRGSQYHLDQAAFSKPKTFLSQVKDRYRQGRSYLECCTNLELMKRATLRYVEEHANKGRDLYFSFSCYPKSMQAQHFENLLSYHRWLKKFYGSQIEAITYQQCAHQVCESVKTFDLQC